MDSRFVSKKSIFSVSNILNPSTDNVLLEKDVQKSAYGLPGIMKFSAIMIALKPDRIQTITKVLASLSQNYSYVRKSYLPIQTLNFFVTGEKTLYQFIKEFSSSELSSSELRFDGTLVNDTDVAQGIDLTVDSDLDKIPQNIVEFKTFAPDYNFLFSPRYNTGRTIFSGLRKFYHCSFTEHLDSNIEVRIPEQSEYLVILPYASSPTPVSLSQTSSKISVSSIISLNIREE
ncbi:hypothetical protein DLM76_17215 [Leptospira yasudae]|uniref:hypothetical protein n=1 Tax=Leptospira yasudae TaxID=2202201 RepID=UPI000E59B78E|nr:hypothetical protein [Leptospira yasudae]RHX91467.1 hypothetical protein DLM76_17215 [Leptospira yasudae]